MFAVYFYLLTLLIAPQLWLPPFVGVPVDFIAFPLLLVMVFVSGRLLQFLRLTVHDLFFAGFVAWMTLSSVINGFSDLSRDAIEFYLKLFLLYKLVATLLTDFTRVRRFMIVFTAMVLLLGIEVVYHRFSPDGKGWAGQTFSWIDPSVVAAGGKGRARWVGIFDGPGVFAVLFAIVLPFTLQLLGREYAKGKRILGALSLALVLVATYFIGSRGGLVATLGVIVLHAMIRIGVAPKTIILASIGCLCVYSVMPSYLTTVRDQSNSTQYRIEMWAEGLDMIKEHPIIGIGRGNFQAYTGKLIAHNSAVEIMGETGLVGLFLWVALIYVSIKSILAVRAERADPRDKAFCTSMMLAIVGYIISAMFVTLEYETFYLLIAMCSALGRIAPQPIALVRRDYRTIGTIIGAALVALQVFVIVYLG